MKKRIPNGLKGFTLVELLVVIAIIALLFVGGMSVLGQLVWLLGVIVWTIIQCLPLLFVIAAAMAIWIGLCKLLDHK